MLLREVIHVIDELVHRENWEINVAIKVALSFSLNVNLIMFNKFEYKPKLI